MEQENRNSFKDYLSAWGKFFASGYFIKNISIYVGSIVLFFIIVFLCLKVYTRHSQKVSVPSVEGLTVDEAIKLLEQRKLTYEISDSIYNSSAKPGTVVTGGQIPRAGFNVKEGRKVFLTIKAWGKEPTTLPGVINVSLSDAQMQLLQAGLILGKVTRQPGKFKDYVVEARFKGAKISVGKPLFKGDVVDLVVQEGEDDRDDSYDYLDNSPSSDFSDSDDGIDNF